jgi:diguanylate cyclase (GGDEF)-like protein
LLAVPWPRLDSRWSLAAIALPIIFVASLSALTGGGESPYSAIYAPILAIAGWYLPLRYLAAAIGLVIATEMWRAVALDGSRSVDQLAVMLPFDIAVAVGASASSTFLRRSLTSTRLDQVQMAATLDAIRALGSDPDGNILHDLERAMERVFDARAKAVTLSTARTGDRILAPALLDGNVATVIVSGASKLHALVTLEGFRPFTKQELRLAAILAETAGRTLDAHDALGATGESANRDSLTGLLNRRALVRDLTMALHGKDADDETVALLFVDLDGFKAINEQFGHDAGDAVLVRLAGLMRGAARDQDRVYRFSGDEFAIVLRGVASGDAVAVATRLIDAAAGSGRRRGEVAVPPVGASVGVALAEPGWTASQLMSAAESAMHAAKNAGGSRAVVHGDAGAEVTTTQ